MKKLFTLLALLAMVLGAQAGEKKIYSVDYSTYTAFPFYVMGYVPEWNSGIMTDLGGNYTYVDVEKATDDQASSGVLVEVSPAGDGAYSGKFYRVASTGTWHQYFIADNIPTEVGGAYHVKALVKASKAVTINVNMGWNWSGGVVGADVSIPAGDDFVEVEWNYTEIGGSSCNLVAQPNTDAQIEWKSLEVYTEESTVPVTWLQMLTNDGKALDEEGHSNKYMGDAEFGAWDAWALETTDGVNINWKGDKTGQICAWSLTMGKNNDTGVGLDGKDLDGRARPYPAAIELEEGTTNHVFAIHVDQVADIDGGASIGWSNQFWIQSPKTWKAGTKVKIKFRYKADRAQRTETQFHKIHPSDYLFWNAVGDVNFTTQWQDFEKTVELTSDTGGAASLAFNLTPDAAAKSDTDSTPKDEASLQPNVFYFDDLSWEVLKLDEGYFVAGKGESVAYDYAQAIQFTQDPEDPDVYVATIGTEGKKDSWVDEIQISTVRGDKSAFLGATLKVGTIKLDEFGMSDWLDYTETSQAKIKLPAAGVYFIEIDTDAKQMRFEQLEGDAPVVKEPVAIVTNLTENVVNATERDWLPADQDGNPVEAEIGNGAAWDNQFWIAANRDLVTDEVTVLKFQYKASKVARTSTQAHKVGDDGKPCTYLHWQAIGDVNFTEEWQDFETTFTVPAGDNGMRSIAFNMAEIKEACDYYIKNVQWYLKDETLEAEGKTYENLINAEGAENFWIKVNSGAPTAIRSITSNAKIGSAVLYNLAGQRVAKDYKGIVVKDGKKYVK
jgi:hypothetical protein